MRIAVFCATRRGLAFLARLARLCPQDELLVVSFREEPHEPPFFELMRELAARVGATFIEARALKEADLLHFEPPADLVFAVSWRFLIPKAVYGRAKLGAFVIHDSLLPRYRGFAPTVWALVNGERSLGATLFEMREEVDAGPIVEQMTIEVGGDERIGEVMGRIDGIYLSLLERNLEGLKRGTAPRLAQDEAQASYTCKRLPEDNRIDWSVSARTVHDLIRAVSRPYPGAFTTLGGRLLRVFGSRLSEGGRRYVGRVPGRVTQICKGEGVLVLAGDGELLLTEVELDGQGPARADELVRSLSVTLGR